MSDGHANHPDLETQYREMASDATRERGAKEWIEGLICDTSKSTPVICAAGNGTTGEL